MITGQVKIAVTGTPVVVHLDGLIQGVMFTALSTNLAGMTVGGSSVTNTVDGTGNGDIFQPGTIKSMPTQGLNSLYINGSSGDIISYVGI